ncbi:MAG: hypothetical protein A2798_01655 [Candidatus Levybacteria bacterium RIFCSPHIGHO2_01_FULL_37_17]|nr:MAG: hypothetical protein A2798_01655 [Candidatus Levybacteria bacterium RIFCSPHIGHO2_01_FULL_37_17]OGH37154.1 MAG: hypothetical protein A2959_02515 [Candidatus Levybacteria bacterium RIFCSPLOWO2_01_FULL_38_23]
MSRKRKTREQKKLADIRHQFNHPSPRLTYDANPTIVQSEIKVQLNAYPYLKKDLIRTALLSSTIIGLQIILFLILKNHLIKLPGISY